MFPSIKPDIGGSYPVRDSDGFSVDVHRLVPFSLGRNKNQRGGGIGINGDCSFLFKFSSPSYTLLLIFVGNGGHRPRAVEFLFLCRGESDDSSAGDGAFGWDVRLVERDDEASCGGDRGDSILADADELEGLTTSKLFDGIVDVGIFAPKGDTLARYKKAILAHSLSLRKQVIPLKIQVRDYQEVHEDAVPSSL
ncbi:hypothetical protein NE237_017685 [Protea cynaroides]|uniref:Uncharacterized protein n=1 Tax=Protea cynaroides TaxID=273540 RepID=A0A9Q0K8L5_9MAGN|nr:hypothetical protein NE237_017685 [Protea cynaroides]